MRPRQELYRLPHQGKIAGVCAGLAEYFRMETWLVRIIFVTCFLFSGAMLIVAYIVAWFILDKPTNEQYASYTSEGSRRSRRAKRQKWKQNIQENFNEVEQQVRSRFERRPIEVKEKVWQSGEPPKQAFHDISAQFRDLEKRLQNLETYVTSTEFTVSREIDKL
jgi:phage shock protein C